MWKLVILALAMALTGCGGGGGGSSNSPAPTEVSVLKSAGTMSVTSTFIPSLTPGDFAGDGSQYVLVSGWLANSSPSSAVKIFKLNSNGTTVDATLSILGNDFVWSVNYPQVADFNHDGIDDIFFPGFTDGPGILENNASVAFMSRPGQSHQRVDLDGLSWNHGTTLVDANQDGWIDVMNARGEIWVNNRAGGFTYRQRDTGIAVANSIAGSGICAGDLDGSGAVQVLVTDQVLFRASQFIYKLNANMEPSYQGALPVPVFDKDTPVGSSNRSHDVSCQIVDVNGDGRKDVIVVSYLYDPVVVRAIGSQSIVQVYYNQGGYVFSDATNTAMTGYNQSVLASYTPKIIDFNNDGKPDIWLMNTNTAESGNQVWLNDGTGKFAQSRRTEFNQLLAQHASVSGIETGTSGIMLPIKVNGKWNFVVASVSSGKNTVYVSYANTQWAF